MKESTLLTTIRNTLCRLPHVRLFRNNTGMLRVMSRDKKGRFVHFGLCVGSSDAIGWTTVTVTPDMIGRRVAVFTAIETKTDKGRATPEQLAFLAAVHAAGGYSGIARSLEQAQAICHQLQQPAPATSSPLPRQPRF